MVGYSALMPASTTNSMESAWLYNLMWMLATWGIQLFFWIQKFLFKSEGGAMHGFFIKAINFGAINYLLGYWIIDIMVLRGTLDFSSTSKGKYWGYLGGLFGL